MKRLLAKYCDVGIDMDEVLANFIDPLLQYYNRKYSKSLRKEDIKTYELSEAFKIPKPDAISMLYDFYKTDFFKSIKPVDCSRLGIDYLRRDHGLYVITARQNEIQQETLDWIDTYFKGCFRGIEFANHNSANGAPAKKSDICKSLNLSLLIEDRHECAEECAEKGIDVLLFNQPWNQDAKENRRITRVYSWQHIIRIS